MAASSLAISARFHAPTSPAIVDGLASPPALAYCFFVKTSVESSAFVVVFLEIYPLKSCKLKFKPAYISQDFTFIPTLFIPERKLTLFWHKKIPKFQ
jgi:hypothetical protein